MNSKEDSEHVLKHGKILLEIIFYQTYTYRNITKMYKEI